MHEFVFPPRCRIAIVGSGAVGCYYGGRLAQQGNDVRFLMRGDFDHVRNHGLDIRSHLGDFHLPEVQCYQRAEDIGPCDLVVITLKSTGNQALPDLIPPLLHENTLLLTLQNGLGNETFLAQHFGADRVLGGICYVCINRTAPGVIEHTAQGNITIGEFMRPAQTRTHQIATLFNGSGVACEVAENLTTARWHKLVWNIPFNGLSIVGGCLDTGRILANEHLASLVKSLMTEVINAAGMLGHELPASLADQMIAQTRTIQPYTTSSLIDFMENREVELESIWGEPCRLARNAGASVGRMEMLYQLLKHQVAMRDAPSPDEKNPSHNA